MKSTKESTLRRLALFAGLACCALLFAVNTWADDDGDDGDEQEQEITLVQVPAKVKAAAMKAVTGLRITEAEVEAVLIYEVEGTAGGKLYEIEVTAEGKVIDKEEESPDKKDKNDDEDEDEDDDAAKDDDKDEDDAEHELSVPLSALPAKVKAAAEKAVPGIKLSKAEVEAVLVYELEGVAGDKKKEIEVTADGKVLEIEDDDKDDDKD